MQVADRAENAQALQELAIFVVDDLAIEGVPVDRDAIGYARDGALECLRHAAFPRRAVSWRA